MGAQKIYLAGSIEFSNDYGKGWREEVTPALSKKGYHVWNPVIEQRKLGNSIEDVIKSRHSNYNKFLEHCNNLVRLDLKALADSKAVFCKIDEGVLKGAGTIGEISVCKYLGIPVYAWIDLKNWKEKLPSWIFGCLPFFSESLDEVIEFVPVINLMNMTEAEKRVHINSYVEEWRDSFSDL